VQALFRVEGNASNKSQSPGSPLKLSIVAVLSAFEGLNFRQANRRHTASKTCGFEESSRAVRSRGPVEKIKKKNMASHISQWQTQSDRTDGHENEESA
jgi:hypothetical protein